MRILPISINFGQQNYTNNVKRQSYVIPSQQCDSVSFTSNPSTMTKQIIIMLGAPNSGKGTFARKIAEKFAIPQISTGDILRKEVKNLTELGKQAKSFMESGGLVPDELIMNIFKKRIAQPDCSRGFILDGFPRTIKQAEQLDEVIKAEKNAQLKVVNLDVDKSILYARSAARYTCQDCSKTHSIPEGFNKETSKCDCGGNLIKRADDTPEILTQRLENYEKQSLPLIDFYGDKVAHVGVHGKDAPAEQTFARVLAKIEE